MNELNRARKIAGIPLVEEKIVETKASAEGASFTKDVSMLIHCQNTVSKIATALKGLKQYETEKSTETFPSARDIIPAAMFAKIKKAAAMADELKEVSDYMKEFADGKIRAHLAKK